jgi:hypothetical protein
MRLHLSMSRSGGFDSPLCAGALLRLALAAALIVVLWSALAWALG